MVIDIFNKLVLICVSGSSVVSEKEWAVLNQIVIIGKGPHFEESIILPELHFLKIIMSKHVYFVSECSLCTFEH